jgi:hypothetical protein
MLERELTTINEPEMSSKPACIWHAVSPDNRQYSLTRVPDDYSYYINYQRPADKVDISIIPTADRGTWRVQGLADIKALVDLKIFRLKPWQIPTARLRKDTRYGFEHFGDVAIYDYKHTLMNMDIYNSNVRKFLLNVWEAGNHGVGEEAYPTFDLNDYEGESYRILPQITSADPLADAEETLQVVFY